MTIQRDGNYIYVPKKFESAADAVELFEKDFEERLTNIALKVASECKSEDIQLLTLVGPTCSGKTTAAHKLTEALEEKGYSVHVISLDDFYFDHETLHKMAEENGGVLDYDTVNVLDVKGIEQCIVSLMACGSAVVPVYNFETGENSERRHIKADTSEKNIFLLEGIQLLYPEITALLSPYRRKSIFISAERGICIGDRYFSTDTIRLYRRLVRDVDRRDAHPEFTLGLWRGVRENEEKSIFPYVGDVDYEIDSTMGYELHMLKPYLEKIMPLVTPASEYFETATRILQSICDLEPIDGGLLPEKSVYHEFITVPKS